MTSATSGQQVGKFLAALASKQSTPGGGAAAAVGAGLGSAAASMAAAYTQRKKDQESGAAVKAEALIQKLNFSKALQFADDDAKAYADLQRSWKDADMSADEKRAIETQALAVPVELVELCHDYIVSIQSFLPDCNPNITSDAKVGIHTLAGAARAAYQTVLVNSPPLAEKERLKALLIEIRTIEEDLLEMER